MQIIITRQLPVLKQEILPLNVLTPASYTPYTPSQNERKKQTILEGNKDFI